MNALEDGPTNLINKDLGKLHCPSGSFMSVPLIPNVQKSPKEITFLRGLGSQTFRPATPTNEVNNILLDHGRN